MNLFSLKGFKTGMLIVLLFVPVLVFFLLVKFGTSHYYVPIYYPQEVSEETNDTIYHKVPPFEFTDQHGNKVTQDFVKDKLFVVDYFFSTCLGPCPKMSELMGVLQDKLVNEDRVLLLSHTVDPVHDNDSVLKDYAALYKADYNKWRFLTGSKEALYKQAREGYFLVATKGDGGINDFIHSQKFVLVDNHRRIRGYYDGTDVEEIKRLLDETAIILRELDLENDEK